MFFRPDLTLEGIVSWWIARTVRHVDDPNLLLVRRGSLLRSTLRLVSRPEFAGYTSEFKVSFSGEEGDDLGGPKREYFR